MKLVRLLQILTPNLDHSRVVHQLRKAENLPLAMDYLKSVQKVGNRGRGCRCSGDGRLCAPLVANVVRTRCLVCCSYAS